jgi:hypothetical protein
MEGTCHHFLRRASTATGALATGALATGALATATTVLVNSKETERRTQVLESP